MVIGRDVVMRFGHDVSESESRSEDDDLPRGCARGCPRRDPSDLDRYSWRDGARPSTRRERSGLHMFSHRAAS